jgi:hypothetical protein
MLTRFYISTPKKYGEDPSTTAMVKPDPKCFVQAFHCFVQA